jgi:chromosome segregation protein
MEGFAHSVKFVMNKAEMGILRGICGPVSKLINVNPKYSTAIEAALSNAIQNIVTDTESDAKKAISFLKSNKGGRATFLPVATIKAREFKEHGFENMEGYIGIASDLIGCDSKYNEIIKYLLGAVIVAEDIDYATAIAKNQGYRVKVVTLDGQVVNPGGSLTGGSIAKNSGLLSRSNDIKVIEADIEKLKIKAKETEQALNNANNDVNLVLADITALQADLTTANEDKIRAIAEAKRLDDLRQSCNTAVNDFIAEQSANSQKVEVLKSSSQTIATQIADIEAKKTSIEAEINSMTGGRDNLNATRESLTNDITALKLSLIEFAKDIESIILSKDNLNKSILERSERVVVIDSEIAALQFKNENLKNEIATVTDGIEELKNKIEDAKNAIADFVERRNQTEKAGVELRNSERENTLQREKISGELARLTERKEVMLREYDDVIRRLYDEYELTRTEAEKIGIEIENPVI